VYVSLWARRRFFDAGGNARPMAYAPADE